MIGQDIKLAIDKALKSLGIDQADFVVEHPADLKMGDYSTNVGIKYRDKKEEILAHLIEHKPEGVEKIELAGPGFINFYLSKEFFQKSLGEIMEKGGDFGRSENLNGQKVVVEHTDPNYFKKLHIGHFMPMTIGSTIANIFRWNSAEVKEACYYSDVGLQAAKAVWAMKQGIAEDPYVAGTKAYDTDENAKKEIIEINKIIYERSDNEINELYKVGSEESLIGFNKIYEKFKIKFDYLFYESTAGKLGGELVRQNTEIFEESDGAVVFHAEKHDPSLHTRVFINGQGLPTYEAKDLGLAQLKHDKYNYTRSVIVTGNEQKEYFRVLMAALKLVFPELYKKTKHLSHGMLRLPTGKMSSRTGDVITAEELIEEVKGRTQGREDVAIGAIKYMILRQAIGSDIVFDFEKSVSTQGDSGVYLQYAHARACSILERAGSVGQYSESVTRETHEIEKLLYRFPEVVERAMQEYAPNHIVTYLTELAGAFNNFYAHEQVLGDSPEAPYRLMIVEAFRNVMKNGLDILGIPAPDRI